MLVVRTAGESVGAGAIGEGRGPGHRSESADLRRNGPWEERIAGSFAQARGTMVLLLVTAAWPRRCSGVAIYGSIWYSVNQRDSGDWRPPCARRQPRLRCSWTC